MIKGLKCGGRLWRIMEDYFCLLVFSLYESLKWLREMFLDEFLRNLVQVHQHQHVQIPENLDLLPRLDAEAAVVGVRARVYLVPLFRDDEDERTANSVLAPGGG